MRAAETITHGRKFFPCQGSYRFRAASRSTCLKAVSQASDDIWCALALRNVTIFFSDYNRVRFAPPVETAPGLAASVPQRVRTVSRRSWPTDSHNEETRK